MREELSPGLEGGREAIIAQKAHDTAVRNRIQQDLFGPLLEKLNADIGNPELLHEVGQTSAAFGDLWDKPQTDPDLESFKADLRQSVKAEKNDGKWQITYTDGFLDRTRERLQKKIQEMKSKTLQ